MLVLVVAAMTFKPTGDDQGMLVAGAAIVAVTIAVGVRAMRAAASAAPAAAAD